MSMTHISRTEAATRLGLSTDCAWEQALKVFNIRRMEIYGLYLAPLNEDDKRQRDAEVIPLYAALRSLFPVEAAQEPTLKDLPLAPPVKQIAPQPTPAIVQKVERKRKRRLMEVSFTLRKTYPIVLVVSAFLFIAFVIYAEMQAPSPPPSSEVSTISRDTILITKPAPIVYVITSTLNLRDEPGLAGKILDSLSTGEELYFLDEKTEWTEEIELSRKVFKDHWVKVRTESGTEGWVFGAFVHYYHKRL